MPPRPRPRTNVVETGGILTHARRAAQPIPAPLRPESDNRFRIGLAAGARCSAVLVLAVSTACAPTVVDTIPPAPIVLAAVTWNTHSGRGDLSRLVADLERGALIPRSDAYLLLLQEVAADELDAVAQPRRWSSCFVPVRGVEGRFRGNAILSSHPLRDQPHGAVAPRAPDARGRCGMDRCRRASAVRRVSPSRKSRELVERRAVQRLGAASSGRRAASCASGGRAGHPRRRFQYVARARRARRGRR